MTMSAAVLLALTILVGQLRAPSRARPGELPRPTREGVAAMLAIVDRAVAGGGLREVRRAGADGPSYEVVDAAKIAGAVEAERERLSPALVDTLAGGWRVYDDAEERLAIALLRAIGERGDDRAGGFARFFTGQIAARARKADEAVHQLDGAVRLFGRAGDPAWQATAHHEAGIALRAAGDYGAAIAHHRAALAIREEVLGKDDPLVATTLNNLGVVHEAVGDLARAEEHHRRALAIRSRALADDDPALASTYRNLGLTLFHAGRLDEAARFSELALAIRRKHARDDPAMLADALGSLGVVRSERGELDAARSLLVEALGITRRLGPDAELSVAELSGNLGVVAKRSGDNPRALVLFGESLSARRRLLPAGHPDIAHALNEMSMAHSDAGELDAALAEQRMSLRIYRDCFGPVHPQVARSLNNLGGLYQRQGDDPRALAGYELALTTWRKVHPRPHPDVAYCLDNIAGVYRRRQAWGEALPRYREALAILEATLGPRHPEVIQNLSGLASACEAAGLDDEATGHASRALQLARDAFPGGHPELASTLNNAAMAKARRGDLAGAERDLLEAREVARRADPGHEALALENLALVRRRAGAYEEADRTLGEALEALRRHAGGGQGGPIPASPQAGRVLARRAEVRELRLGPDPDAAGLRECVSFLEAAADVLDRLRGDVIGSDEGKIEAGEDSHELFPELIGLRRRLFAAEGRAEDLREALVAAERASARVFLETLARSNAGRIGGVDRDLLDRRAALEARLRSLDGRIEAEQSRPFEARRPDEIARLRRDRDRIESELGTLIGRIESDFPRYAALMSPRPCSPEEARKTLAADEVALLFVPGERGSELVVLSGGDDPSTTGLSIHHLPPAPDIVERIEALTRPKVLEDRDAARERGAELYSMLLGPAAGLIRGKGLVIVAGGPPGTLPFEMLIEPAEGEGEGRWLVESHRIRYAPSLTALHPIGRWESTRRPPSRPLWALGDPVYRPDDARLAAGPAPAGPEPAPAGRPAPPALSGSFDRIPASGEELARLRALMGAAVPRVRTGNHDYHTSSATSNSRSSPRSRPSRGLAKSEGLSGRVTRSRPASRCSTRRRRSPGRGAGGR